MIDIIRKEINKKYSQAVNLIRRGILTLVNDSTFAQWEANDGELYDESEFWQDFGFASRPPTGGEILFAILGGHGEHAIGFATNDRAHRPSGLAYGDSVHYASKSGSNQARAHAKATGDYDILCGASSTVNVGDTASGCADFVIKGTSYNSAINTMLATIETALGLLKSEAALTTPTKTACGTAETAINTFRGNSYVSTKVKVK